LTEDIHTILRVAVAAPLPNLFDYLPAAGWSGTLAPGMRVLVPFGRSRRVGMIVELTDRTEQDRDRLRPVDSLLDAAPLLTPSDLRFILWAASYYRHPPGEALFSALPARMRRSSPALESGEPGWRLTPDGREGIDGLTRAPRQMQVAKALLESTAGLAIADLTRGLGDCRAALRALAVRGWAEPCRIPIPAQEQVVVPAKAGPKLNPHQQRAVESVREVLGGFHAFLLEGITGSGKTEVYIHLLQAVLAAGRQALILVPEIGLTPQLLRRLVERVSAPMVTLHSALSAGERERAWHRAACGDAALVVGTRSAVFVPMPRLGLILVDEEHDLSFKQQDGFRYSARDLAVRRAQQADCPVVLGSATPSLETLHNARNGRYGLLDLPERAGSALPPELVTLDIRAQPLRAGLSPVLMRLMGEQLEAGNQVLLFLNRRGFAPVLTCHDCGWVGECPHCDARLTLHLSANRLWCHHCGLTRQTPDSCPECKGTDLRPLGRGTERLEAELRELFPGTPLARVDRDSTRRKGELERLLDAARRGEIPLLMGTQMLAKGHHFPGVTLVGILDLDQGLYGSDFRAPERMAQLVVQVAGRAGRAQRPGRVVLQTRHPDHPLLITLQRQGYGAFATAALEERKQAALPPFSHQALMRAESGDARAATDFLHRAMQQATDAAARGVMVLGPVPAPMERRGGRYRSHLLLQSNLRSGLQGFLADWLPKVGGLRGVSRVRWSLDVDPQEML
jgi:primosomal protein N' (replication factor Y) (superfamily II helicase)